MGLRPKSKVSRRSIRPLQVNRRSKVDKDLREAAVGPRVTYTGLAIAFFLICVGLGVSAKSRVETPWLAVGLAAAMTAAQFALLVLR